MANFDFFKLLRRDYSLMDETIIYNSAKTLQDYINQLNKIAKNKDNSIYEGFINLPFDHKLIKQIKEISKRKASKFLKYIVVIGIGGSNLGAKAVYEALGVNYTTLLFVDTCSPKLLRHSETLLKKELINSEQVLFCLISKSGKTTESIVNFEFLYGSLVKQFSDLSRRVVVVSDEGSQLFQVSRKLGFEVMSIPLKTIGRYSVFSAVGLLPLALSGVNIERLCEGAKDITSYCLKLDLRNPALVSAILIYLYYKNGFTINNNFFFNPELEGVGKWYRQLMAESLGKEFDKDGRRVNIGITPIVSIGSTDLHSMLQLYLAGPYDKFTTFVYAQENNSKVRVPEKTILNKLEGQILGKEISLIMRAIYEGVKKAYLKRKLPFVEIQLPAISEYYLGAYLQFKMIEMLYLGKLFNVEVFDQPNVEEYKREARRILKIS